MSKYAYHIYLLLALMAVLALAGCGGKSTIVPQPEVIWQDSKYETLWVEPQIILADSLITLIRSDRIDSILADQTTTARSGRPSIEIRIFEPQCNVSVGLVDDKMRLVHPMLLRNLTFGYYQLTVNLDRFDRLAFGLGDYYLRADYCGQVQMTAVSIE